MTGSGRIASALLLAMGAASSSFAACDPGAPSFLWAATLNGPANGGDGAMAAAFTPDGGVVVAGYEDRADLGQAENWLIRKYAADGSVLWSRSYNGAGDGADLARGIVVDGGGAICVVGSETRSDVSEGFNWLIRKYDAGGTLLWSRSYNHPATFGLDDEATGVSVDGAGNLFVSGWVYEGTLTEQMNMMLRAYDASGALLWSRTISNSQGNDDLAYALTRDGAGRLIVAGSQDDPEGAGSDYDWSIWTWDSAGNSAWTRSYGGQALLADEAQAAGVDAAGNIYAGGYEVTAGTNADWLLRSYDASGNLRWSKSHSGGNSYLERIWGLAVRGDGFVLAGGINRAASDDWLVRMYDAAGAVRWTVSYAGAAGGNDWLQGVSWSPDDRFALVGAEVAAGQGDNWLVRVYQIPACPPDAGLPALGAGVRPYPNPVTDDRVSIALDLSGDAVRLEVEIFNAAMQRVRRAVWSDVTIADGGVVMDGMQKIMPGVYLLRVRAIQADGDEQRFAPVRLVIQRVSTK